jgi:hypothetical protein
MPAPSGAFVVKNSLLTVDGTDYANQCTKSQLVPDQPLQQVRTLVPDGVVSDVDSATYTWDISGLQINRAGGLARYLRSLTPGTQISVVMGPNNVTGDQKASFTAIAMIPPLGEEQGKFATVDLSMPVLGSPVFADI